MQSIIFVYRIVFYSSRRLGFICILSWCFILPKQYFYMTHFNKSTYTFTYFPKYNYSDVRLNYLFFVWSSDNWKVICQNSVWTAYTVHYNFVLFIPHEYRWKYESTLKSSIMINVSYEFNPVVVIKFLRVFFVFCFFKVCFFFFCFVLLCTEI